MRRFFVLMICLMGLGVIAQQTPTPYVKSFFPPVLAIPSYVYSGPELHPIRYGWRTSIPNTDGITLEVVTHNFIDTTELILEYSGDQRGASACARQIERRCILPLEINRVDDTTYIIKMGGFIPYVESEWGYLDANNEYLRMYRLSGDFSMFCHVAELKDTLGNLFAWLDPRYSPFTWDSSEPITDGARDVVWVSQLDHTGPHACCPSPDSGATLSLSEWDGNIKLEVFDYNAQVMEDTDTVYFPPLSLLEENRLLMIYFTHPWSIDSTSIIMSVNGDTIRWGAPGLYFYRGVDVPWGHHCKIELNTREAGLTFDSGDTVRVCLLDVTDSLYLVGPANHLGTDWHASYGPPVPYCWEFYISPTAVSEPESKPESIGFYVYPNPANRVVRFKYIIDEDNVDVVLVVYDVLGRRVNTVVSGMRMRGVYEASWDSGDISSGVYFAVLRAGTRRVMERFVYVK